MLYCICRKWREEKGKVELLDSPEEGRGGLFAKLKPLLICQNCQASIKWQLLSPLLLDHLQGVGEDGEVRQCEKERHNICTACCNLSKEAPGEVLCCCCCSCCCIVVVVLLLLLFCFGGAHDKNFPSHLTCLSQGCPLCSSPMMGRHSFLEKVVDQQFLYTSLAQLSSSQNVI